MMECYVCQRRIPRGENYVSVDYHIEQTLEPDIIQVEQAESLFTACFDCAPSRAAIAGALAAAGFPVGPSPDGGGQNT